MGVYGSLVQRPDYYFISPALDGTSRAVIHLLKVPTRHILACIPPLYQGNLICSNRKFPIFVRIAKLWELWMDQVQSTAGPAPLLDKYLLYKR